MDRNVRIAQREFCSLLAVRTRNCVAQLVAHHGEAFQHAKGVMDGGKASQCASSAIAREWYDGLINVAWRETFALILASIKQVEMCMDLE